MKWQNDLRMHLSISQLTALTGHDRRTIAEQLKNLQYTVGEPRAMQYESAEALLLVYAVDNLGRALRESALGGTAKRNTS